jgi:transcriptional regulator with XRE-family HTH domain
MSLTSAQCRAARALIGWSQDQLAAASKVAKATIANFETGKRTPYARTLDDVREVLEAAGVVFVDENGSGAGVRLWKPRAEVLEIKSGYQVQVALPGHALPHVLKDDFLTEEGATAWAESAEGQKYVSELGERWWRRQRESEG